MFLGTLYRVRSRKRKTKELYENWFLWVITRRVMVISYRRFGTIIGPILTLEDGTGRLFRNVGNISPLLAVIHFGSARGLPIVNSHHEISFNKDWSTSIQRKTSSELMSRRGHSKRGLKMKVIQCFGHLTRQFGRNFQANQRLSHWHLDRRP
jgi:hypothetical protein